MSKPQPFSARSAGACPSGADDVFLDARLIGETSFLVNGVDIGLTNRKSRSLLAYLCLSDAGSESRERIVDVLWSEAEPQRARASLRQAIYEVSSRLSAAGFGGFRKDTLAIRLRAASVRCDVREILSSLETGSVHPQLLRRKQLTDALLEDLDSTDPAFSTWLRSQREVFRRRLLLGLEAVLAAASDGALQKQAATALFNLEPAHEIAVRALMRLYQADNNSGAALDVYKRLWEHLEIEFDVEPSTETQALAAEIKLEDHAPPVAPAPEAQERAPIVSTTAALARARCLVAVALKCGAFDRARMHAWISKLHPTARWNDRGDGTTLIETDRMSDAARLALALAASSGPPGTLEAFGEIAVGLDYDLAHQAEAVTSLAHHGSAGQVLATEAARDQLVEGVDALIQDRGFLEGMPSNERLRAFMLVPLVMNQGLGDTVVQKMQPTLAIVPMFPVDCEASQQLISVLATEELANELSRSEMIDVISPLSSRRLAGRALPPIVMGKRLGADYLLLIEMQQVRSGGRLNVELVDSQTGVMKWHQRTELRKLSTEGIKAAVERIAHECLAALIITQLAHTASAPLTSLDSYKLLFSGIALMDRWTRASFQRSHEHLLLLRQRAPLHHWPNAWLSAWHIRSISQGWTPNAAADGKAAIEYARLALDSNASCSLAIAMEGWAHVYGSRRLDIAIDRMQCAVSVNHSHSLAWLLKGITHAFIDQPEQAAQAVERALKLSPLDPRRSYYEAIAAGALVGTDQHERTIALAESSLRANRLHASPLRALATAQWYSGREQDARDSVRRLIEVDPKFTVDRYLRQHPASESKYGRRIVEALRAAGAP